MPLSSYSYFSQSQSHNNTNTSVTDQRYNPGLRDRGIEKKKLEFLEHTIRPLLPNDPLFKSQDYISYKESITNGSPVSLKLLAAKRCAELAEGQFAGLSNRPSILSCSLPDDVKGTSFFVRTVVNASLLQKEFGPGKAFIGLFPHTQSVEESPLPHLGMLTTTTPSKCDKEIGSAYFHNNEMKFTGEYVAEEHSIPGFNERRLLRGEKKEIPQLGTQFIGEVTEEVFSGNPQRLFRKRTGIWGDLGNGRWGLTQQGTEEEFGPDGKMTVKRIGIWEDDLGIGHSSLTQQGTVEELAPMET